VVVPKVVLSEVQPIKALESPKVSPFCGYPSSFGSRVRLSIVGLIVVIAMHTQYFACVLWLTEGVKLLVTYECLPTPFERPSFYGPSPKTPPNRLWATTCRPRPRHPLRPPPLISAPQQYFVAVDSAALTSTLEQFVSARIPRHPKFRFAKVC